MFQWFHSGSSRGDGKGWFISWWFWFLIAKQRAAEKFDVVGVNWLKDEKTVLENQKDWGERKQIWKEGTYGKVVDCWK